MEAGKGAPGHKRFEEMAVAHVLGGLNQTDGRVFRAHLLECGECRARVGELRAIAHELADVERDERRVRAAKAIETKRRETDEDDDEQSERRPRSGLRSRVLAGVALVAVAMLAAWAFTLRQNVSTLETQLDARVDAEAVLHFGSDWEVSQIRPDVEGVVRVRDGQLVVLADGLAEDEVYGLYLLGADDDVAYRAAVQAPGGRLLSVPIDVSADARQVLLTLPNSQPGPEPAGVTVLDARRPS